MFGEKALKIICLLVEADRDLVANFTFIPVAILQGFADHYFTATVMVGPGCINIIDTPVKGIPHLPIASSSSIFSCRAAVSSWQTHGPKPKAETCQSRRQFSIRTAVPFPQSCNEQIFTLVFPVGIIPTKAKNKVRRADLMPVN